MGEIIEITKLLGSWHEEIKFQIIIYEETSFFHSSWAMDGSKTSLP
jgi:hypothetical protein